MAALVTLSSFSLSVLSPPLFLVWDCCSTVHVYPGDGMSFVSRTSINYITKNSYFYKMDTINYLFNLHLLAAIHIVSKTFIRFILPLPNWLIRTYYKPTPSIPGFGKFEHWILLMDKWVYVFVKYVCKGNTHDIYWKVFYVDVWFELMKVLVSDDWNWQSIIR